MAQASAFGTSKIIREAEFGRIDIDGVVYDVSVLRRTVALPEAPRLIVVSYLPNPAACEILRVCVQTIRRYTPEPHELWVVDNNSPWDSVEFLLRCPNVNLGLNRTEPIPPERRRSDGETADLQSQPERGSYANAIALELGARLIDPNAHSMMTLHMDTMPCREGWLSFLRSKLGSRVAAAGVRLDKGRTSEGVLHVLGNLIDFKRFRALQLDFLPQLPRYDVGDRVTVELRAAGYEVFACRNSLWDPCLVDTLPKDSAFRELPVDRSLDDEGNVMFLHLGRGVRKSLGVQAHGLTPERWVRFGDEYLLA